MKKILLVCSEEESCNLLITRMYDVVEQKKIEIEIFHGNEDNYKQHLNEVDLILLAPQMNFLEDEIKKDIGKTKPIEQIDVLAYGRLDGGEILEFALAKM